MRFGRKDCNKSKNKRPRHRFRIIIIISAFDAKLMFRFDSNPKFKIPPGWRNGSALDFYCDSQRHLKVVGSSPTSGASIEELCE